MKKTIVFFIFCMFFMTLSSGSFTGENVFWKAWNNYRNSDTFNGKIKYLNIALRAWKPEIKKKNLELIKFNLMVVYYREAMKHYKKYFKNKKKYYFKKAIRLLTLSINSKQTPYNYFYRGQLYYFTKKYKKAENDFSNGIRVNPEEMYNYKFLADLYIKNNKFNKTKILLENAVKILNKKMRKTRKPDERKTLKKDKASILGLLVRVNFNLYNFKTGISLVHKALAVYPKTTDYNLSYYGFLSSCMLAVKAFGDKNYDRAITLYKLAMKYRLLNNNAKNNTKRSVSWNYYLNLVRKRKRLGNINARAVHRITAVFIKNSDVNFIDYHGNRVKVKTQIKDKYLKFIIWRHKLLKRMIETLSGGKWTLSFKMIHVNAAVKNIKSGYFVEGSFKREMRVPDYNTITPFNLFGGAIKKTMSKTDSYIIYWAGGGIGTTAGGGSSRYPLVPYQLYTPLKGWVSYPVGYKWKGFTPDRDWAGMGLVHEFFHTIQGMSVQFRNYGIRQIHEYKKIHRHKIPEWQGNGELDYYVWRFNNTLSKIGWKKLTAVFRKGKYPSERTILRNKNKVKNISISKRKKAHEFYVKYKKSKKIDLIKNALNLNPYYINALMEYANYFKNKKKYKFALKYIKRASYLFPENDYFYLIQARVLSKLKLYKKSLLSYTKAIKVNPEYNFYYYWRGCQYFKTNAYQKAIKDLTHFIGNDKTFAWAFYNRGIAYYNEKKYKNAVKDFTKAINLKPTRYFYYMRGFVYYYNLNNKPAGLKDIRKAAKMGSKRANKLLKNIN